MKTFVSVVVAVLCAVTVTAQPVGNFSSLRLGVAGTTCQFRTLATGTPTGGASCDVTYVVDTGSLWTRIGATWRRGITTVDASTALADGTNLARLDVANVFTAVQSITNVADLSGLTITAVTTGQPRVAFNNSTTGSLGAIAASNTGALLFYSNANSEIDLVAGIDSVRIGKTATTYDAGLAIRASAVNAGIALRESYAGNSLLFSVLQNSGDASGVSVDLQDGNGTSRLLLTSDPASPAQIGLVNGGLNAHWIVFANTGDATYIGQESSAGGNILAGSTPYAMVLVTGGGHPIQFGTNNIVRQTISSTGVVTFNGVPLIGTDGKVPALSSTYFASLSAANLTAVPAAELSGTITSATQDLITRTGTIVSGTWNAGGITASTLAGSGVRCVEATNTGQLTLDANSCNNGSSFDMTNNVFLTGADTGATPRNLIGMSNSDDVLIATGAFDVRILPNGGGHITLGTTATPVLWINNDVVATTDATVLLGSASNVQFRFASAAGAGMSPTLGVNNAYATAIIGNNTVVEAASGTHPLIAGLAIRAPTVTAGAGAVTSTATLYIESAITATASTSYALWVDSGNTKLDGALTVDGAVSFNGTVTGDVELVNAVNITSRTTGAALKNLLSLSNNNFVYVGDTDNLVPTSIWGSSIYIGPNLAIGLGTPTTSSGFGAGETIIGKSSMFKVTVGAGGDTTGVVAFNISGPSYFSGAPSCTANNETSAQLIRATPTTTQVTLNGTMAASDVISVICLGGF